MTRETIGCVSMSIRRVGAPTPVKSCQFKAEAGEPTKISILYIDHLDGPDEQVYIMRIRADRSDVVVTGDLIEQLPVQYCNKHVPPPRDMRRLMGRRA